ncbi:MAG: DUF2207 domain-containing protein [Candidatus Doudnabacteria bacterium]|nr:DUF2207 domain-containing protein [Candidatus Doudnabacteria bacterium]
MGGVELSDYLPAVASPWDLFTMFKAPLAYVLPLLVLVAAVIGVLWYRRRFTKDDQSVVAEYEPPEGLSPAEIGLMHDFELSSNRLVFAEVAWLVSNGYIRMEGVGEQATFSQTDAYEPGSFRLKDHQHRIMRALFEQGTTTSYGDVLSLGKEAFQSEILASMRTRGYIRLDPRQAKQVGRDTAIGMILVGFGGIGWAIGLLYMFLRVQLRTRMVGAWALYLSFYVSAVQKFLNIGLLSLEYPPNTIMSHGFIFPSIPELLVALIAVVAFMFVSYRTPKGEQLKRRVEGFRDYLNTAELTRSQYVEETEGRISDWSAYALAFGLPSRWDTTFDLKESGTVL